LVNRDEALKSRLETYKLLVDWNSRLDPVCFVEHGREPTMSMPGTN
jgi:hypothetical protein